MLITCIVIYKLTSKNKTNISSTKGSIKEILKLDNDLKNILEKHTKILESNTGGDSQKETLKSLKIVADEIMTMENNIYQMTDEEQNSRGLKRIKRAIKNLRNNYKTMGYDIPILLGTEWKEGDTIEIISDVPDINIEKGKLKDYSGLDCCTWIIELNNGEFLEPVNIESFNINMKNNNKICVKYLVLNNVHSCCMFGQIVEIEDIN